MFTPTPVTSNRIFYIYAYIRMCLLISFRRIFDLINNKKLSHLSLVTVPVSFSRLTFTSPSYTTGTTTTPLPIYAYTYACSFLITNRIIFKNINNRKKLCRVARLCCRQGSRSPFHPPVAARHPDFSPHYIGIKNAPEIYPLRVQFLFTTSCAHASPLPARISPYTK